MVQRGDDLGGSRRHPPGWSRPRPPLPPRPPRSAGWSELRRPGKREATTPSPFSRLALTHCLAVAGDTLVTMALAGSVFFSISPQAARGRVALFLLLTMAPFAVVAPFLGPVLDRSRGGRRAMLILAGGGRAAVCLLMSAHLGGLLLFPEAFAVLVLSKAHAVTKSALVPAMVSDQRGLVEANARLAVLAVVVGFVAAIPGAAVLKLPFLGASWVTLLAAACFAASACAAMLLPRPSRSGEPLEGSDGQWRSLETEELHAATIRLSAVSMSVLRAIVGFLAFLVAFSFRRSDAPAWWFGIALGASMLGTFVGNAAAPWLRRRVHEERMLLGALLVVAVGGFVAGRSGGRPAIAFLAWCVGLAAAAGKLAFDSIVQRDAPDALRGRTFARFETRFQLVWVAGAFLPVLIPIPADKGMLLISLGSAVTFAVYLSLHGRWRAAPPAAPRPAPPGDGY